MERIYENAGLVSRSNISIVVLVVVLIYGVWEIYSAVVVNGGESTGIAFGVLFIGGGLYGLQKTMNDTRDLVAAIDADASGHAAITLWRPFSRQVIETRIADITGIRFWIKAVSRLQRGYNIFFRVPSYPRELSVELRHGQAISDGLRRLAPQAVDEFELNTGVKKPSAEAEDEVRQ
jgi:hypothetical protein